MNITAVAITGIICITVLVAQIIAEVAKTKRHTTELAAGRGQQTAQDTDAGFMDIPDYAADELPFR